MEYVTDTSYQRAEQPTKKYMSAARSKSENDGLDIVRTMADGGQDGK